MLDKQQKRYRRHKRIRARVKGTSKRPRLCVFRSPRHIYAQLIDDERGMTIVSASDQKLNLKVENQKIGEKKENNRSGKIGIAYEVGRLIAEKALHNGIKEVVFDRGGFMYHGRIKAVADGARDNGLKF